MRAPYNASPLFHEDVTLASLPKILETREIARSQFFRIEAVELEFATGERRTYERLPAGRREAVIVVAINARDEILLIREYAAGFHELQLTLPKGACDHESEALTQAANRELKEEAGFGARDLRFIKKLSVAPGHMGFTINVVLARDLYEERLPGDEPEPPEVVPWPVARLDELLASDTFNEARAIAALALIRSYL